jgi:hypothetical protein
MKKSLTLWARLKPEYKSLLAKDFADRPFSHRNILETLESEYYFTEIKYGIVHDILDSCNLVFFGDAFEPTSNE